MLPGLALLLLLLFFSFLCRCYKDLLFNLRVSILTESDLCKEITMSVISSVHDGVRARARRPLLGLVRGRARTTARMHVVPDVVQ